MEKKYSNIKIGNNIERLTCSKCQSTEFLVCEIYWWEMESSYEASRELDKTNEPEGGVEEIVCKYCSTHLPESEVKAYNWS